MALQPGKELPHAVPDDVWCAKPCGGVLFRVNSFYQSLNWQHDWKLHTLRRNHVVFRGDLELYELWNFMSVGKVIDDIVIMNLSQDDMLNAHSLYRLGSLKFLIQVIS